ncbi:hypothetical protein [Segniliparus rugosus]|uniref:Uncharacterized protein n=1 Tax=Segniliparus rugosus (strain ATCC BAA-974 / DSM 45345 / CCUG 50838 / CIP 108380 / JCM 13579 / CDC 945) TaxID=679197 RepID=E5XLQ0_SEGRC|nr:hypothetical protein [Segniliparus rugosus]EFV14728.1 hypothetical protein HMPREF9336_00419 [Segniliparus rugosus ATCC BAA-974]
MSYKDYVADEYERDFESNKTSLQYIGLGKDKREELLKFWRETAQWLRDWHADLMKSLEEAINPDGFDPNDKTRWAGTAASSALGEARAVGKIVEQLADAAQQTHDTLGQVTGRFDSTDALVSCLVSMNDGTNAGKIEAMEAVAKALQHAYLPLGDVVIGDLPAFDMIARLPGGAPGGLPPVAGAPGAASPRSGAPGGAPTPDALKALTEQAQREAALAQQSQHDSEAPATSADPSQAVKGAADALGQAGQAAGQAAQGAGQAGKGLDPSQLASGLADALKPKDGAGLGAGTDAALDVSDSEAGLPGSLDAAPAAFAAPIGGGSFGAGGGGATEPRRLSAASGHGGGPTQQAQPASQLSSLAQPGSAAPAGGMGSMPMGGAPMHGQQGQGGKAVGPNKYLRDAAANKEAFLSAIPTVPQEVLDGVGVVGALTDAERTEAAATVADAESSVESDAREFK